MNARDAIIKMVHNHRIIWNRLSGFVYKYEDGEFTACYSSNVFDHRAYPPLNGDFYVVLWDKDNKKWRLAKKKSQPILNNTLP